ncbi:MAG TPA: hypothetical protein VH681_06540 [Nitrospiraceae bacterium]
MFAQIALRADGVGSLTKGFSLTHSCLRKDEAESDIPTAANEIFSGHPESGVHTWKINKDLAGGIAGPQAHQPMAFKLLSYVDKTGSAIN